MHVVIISMNGKTNRSKLVKLLMMFNLLDVKALIVHSNTSIYNDSIYMKHNQCYCYGLKKIIVHGCNKAKIE
jgi:hypothetical protein